jgi:hypothetical protein
MATVKPTGQKVRVVSPVRRTKAEEMSPKLRTTRRSGRSEWMDIAGAKALKQRLGPNAADDARPDADIPAEVSADAPPVYHWTGVSKAAPEAPAVGGDEPANGASLFTRLALSFR